MKLKVLDGVIVALAVVQWFIVLLLPLYVERRFYGRVDYIYYRLFGLSLHFWMLVSVLLLLVAVAAIIASVILRQTNTNPINRAVPDSPVYKMMSLAGLNVQGLDQSTSALGFRASWLNFVAVIILITQAPEEGMVADGGWLLVVIVLILVGLSFFRTRTYLVLSIASGGSVNGRLYLDVVEGSLVGARPQIDPQHYFTIGRREDNDLVLWDDGSVDALHACIFYQNNRTMLRVYEHAVVLNSRVVQPGDYPIKQNDLLQVGHTRLYLRARTQ